MLDTRLAARLVIVIFNKERMSAILELEATTDGIGSTGIVAPNSL
jgi:hypothetical protein